MDHWEAEEKVEKEEKEKKEEKEEKEESNDDVKYSVTIILLPANHLSLLHQCEGAGEECWD